MRFRWGQMNFSTPSRFLAEIDAQFVESDFDLRATRRNRELNVDEGEDAITVMRRRYDVRHQEQKRSTPINNFPSRPATPAPAPKPQPPQPTYNADRLKRVVTTPSTATTTAACAYSVGQRVSHPKFGNGRITAIDALATDHKLVVEFEAFGSKTLLAKLAKLTVL
jgi:DNA helicase-2/ATP-dependent DNA helicase PcrA